MIQKRSRKDVYKRQEHDSALGNAPSHLLFDAITVKRRDETKPPRAFGDYDVEINREAIPLSLIHI